LDYKAGWPWDFRRGRLIWIYEGEALGCFKARGRPIKLTTPKFLLVALLFKGASLPGSYISFMIRGQ
jgi:hypothetical protein